MTINVCYKRQKKGNQSDGSQDLEKCIHCDTVDFSTEEEIPVRGRTAHQLTLPLATNTHNGQGFWLAGGRTPLFSCTRLPSAHSLLRAAGYQQ